MSSPANSQNGWAQTQTPPDYMTTPTVRVEYWSPKYREDEGLMLAEAELTSPELKKLFMMKTCGLIHDLSLKLKLGKVATYSAYVFFHRFFRRNELFQHDRKTIAAACIYLAAKVEECNQVKLTLIVRALMDLTNEHLPVEEGPKNEKIQYWKDRVMVCERAIMYSINFNINVPHPFKAMQDFMRLIRDDVKETKKEFDDRTIYMQACKFLKESMMTSSFLDWTPEYHAAVAIYLTLQLYQVDEPDPRRTWADVMRVADAEKLLADCVEVCDLYNPQRFPALGVDAAARADEAMGGEAAV